MRSRASARLHRRRGPPGWLSALSDALDGASAVEPGRGLELALPRRASPRLARPGAAGRHDRRLAAVVAGVTRARGGEEGRERQHCADEGEEDWPRHCHRSTYRQQPGRSITRVVRAPPHRRPGAGAAPVQSSRLSAPWRTSTSRPSTTRAPPRSAHVQQGARRRPRRPGRRPPRAARIASSPSAASASSAALQAHGGAVHQQVGRLGRTRVTHAEVARQSLAALGACGSAPTPPRPPRAAPRPRRGRRRRRRARARASPAGPRRARRGSPRRRCCRRARRRRPKVSVFAAPMAVAAGLRLSASSSAATLCGTVTLSPRKPEPPRAATTGPNSALGQRQRHVEPVQAQLGQRRVVHRRRAAVAHRRAGHPEQRAAHQQLVGDCPPRRARSRL